MDGSSVMSQTGEYSQIRSSECVKMWCGFLFFLPTRPEPCDGHLVCILSCFWFSGFSGEQEGEHVRCRFSILSQHTLAADSLLGNGRKSHYRER